MRIIKSSLFSKDKTLLSVVDILKKGGLVVVPTDTVYGLAVDAASQKAVDKLTAFKSRPPGRPISVFVRGMRQLKETVSVDRRQEATIQKLLPGPFTIILPVKKHLARGLASERGTLGVRIPQFAFITGLVADFGRPISATSANVSGGRPHYSIDSFLKEIPAKKKPLIDLIVDFGKLPRNKPSTVVDLSGGRLKLLRRGDVAVASGKKNVFISKTPDETKKIARFLLDKHRQKMAQKPPIFLIEGELGVGKTIFVKGIGEALGVYDIVSPTFVVYHEYETPTKKLFHFDLYNLDDPDEFEHLGIQKILNQNAVVCIEWGEKSGAIFQLLKDKGTVVYVKIKYKSIKEREIEIC